MDAKLAQNIGTAEGNGPPHFPAGDEKWRSGSCLTLLPRACHLFSAARNPQVILNRKNTRNAIRSNARHVFVAFAIDHAFQRDVSTLHDDMNRWYGRKSVAR